MNEKWHPLLENERVSVYHKKKKDDKNGTDILIGEEEVTLQTKKGIKKKSRELFNRLSLLVNKNSSSKTNSKV